MSSAAQRNSYPDPLLPPTMKRSQRRKGVSMPIMPHEPKMPQLPPPVTASQRGTPHQSLALRSPSFPVAQPVSIQATKVQPVKAIPKKPPIRPVKKQTLSPQPIIKSEKTIVSFQQANTMPFWLRSLSWLYRSSLALTFTLVGTSLGIYGLIVYTQQLWGHEFQKLENLQRDERYLLTTNESLKHQLANQAEDKQSGLVPSTPAANLFLTPAPVPSMKAKVSPLNSTPEPFTKPPLGY